MKLPRNFEKLFIVIFTGALAAVWIWKCTRPAATVMNAITASIIVILFLTFVGWLGMGPSYRQARTTFFVVFYIICFCLTIGAVLLLPASVYNRRLSSIGNGRTFNLTILQLNDIYEIVPLEKGKTGGLDRFAHFRKQLAEDNPGTVYSVVAGDFLSPSAIGTLKDKDGARIAGRQMVDVMNEAGIDLVTFGNHEFDLKPAELQRCIDRSRFEWVNINSRDSISNFSRSFMQWKDSVATPIPYTVVKNFEDEEGNTMSVGFFGVTIRTSAHTHVAYSDIKESAAMALRELKGKCDVIVAITHLSMKEDKQLASDFPEINLVIGGHEHIYSYNRVGTTPIAKADANARSMYVHKLAFNKDNHKVSITSNLVRIDDRMASDVATRQVADTWNKRADSLLKAKGFSPCRVVASPGVTWDATDNSIRADTTNLSLLIGRAMMAVVNNNADFALYNSGSVRLDDSLRAPVTEYDIFRLMPYDNLVRVVMLKGNMLLQALQVSDTSRGDGCFLQHDGSISKDKGTGSWLINGKAINPGASYRVATTDYLAEGKQPRMEFLGGAAVPVGLPASAKIVEPDLRKAVMDYMKKMYKPNGGMGKVGVLPCY